MNVERPRQEEDYKYERSDDAAINDSILKSCATRGFGVRDACESDHRVKRQIFSGQCGFQSVIQFLFCSECFRCGLVSHLDEIPDRKIGKRVGVFFSAMKVFGECALAVLGKLFEALIEHDAIFEGSIHSLTVKWYDRVRGIADEANLVAIKPGRAANGHE